MPKNMFQRPQPINHSKAVPRHGKPQATVAQKPGKHAPATPAPALPPLEALLHGGQHR